MRLLFPSLLLVFAWIAPAYSQLDTTGQALVQHAAQHALRLYQAATPESQYLYNGREYFVYDNFALEHQFFQSEDWEDGSVFYDGRLYQDIPMMYDLVKDELIIEQRKGGNVQLQNQQVKGFSMLKHTFIRLEESQTGLRTGFYDLLYDGKTRVLAKRLKERQESIEDMKVVISFNLKTHFYLYKDGTYHAVNTKKSVLALLEDQKPALRKYLRTHRLKFRKGREAVLLTLTAYYDQLTNP